MGATIGRLGAAVAAMLVVATACSSGGGQQTSGSTTTTAAAATVTGGAAVGKPALSPPPSDHGTKDLAGTSLSMEADDFYFAPTFVKAKPGTTVTVNLKNDGKVPHTFTVEGQNVDQTLNPAQTATVQVRVPSTGSVVYYCRFHRSSGMLGAFYLG